MIVAVIRLKQLQNETLVPKHKTDTAAAHAAVEAGYPAVEPVLPQLTEWMQDYNWPVAKVLGPFLASIGRPIIPHVDMVLASNDAGWKYWIISVVIAENPLLLTNYLEELTRIANKPTSDEKHHELDDVAREALAKTKSDWDHNVG